MQAKSEVQTGRDLIVKWWNEAWDEGLWAASWKKSLEGLTAAQAAWAPASPVGVRGPRHSIWQIVLHMVFWRENWLARLDGGARPSDEETADLNFPAVTDISEAAWAAARRKFEDSQRRIAAALKERGAEAGPMMYFLPHDCYHFGQINYLRAMQGVASAEG
ncbi:MAG: DinB family protein [Phycisphaeraceae bacterium]|nr:DinB family protein [Phycisphaeraceae bacterium]